MPSATPVRTMTGLAEVDDAAAFDMLVLVPVDPVIGRTEIPTEGV